MEEQPNEPHEPPREQQNLEAKLSSMLQRVILPENSGVFEQCIYRVPQKIREINPKAYTPRLVAIGPFHKPCHSDGKNNNILEPMEEMKLKYFKGFLNRDKKLRVGDLVPKLKDKETGIRSCYAEPIHYNSDDFLKMILIDACFIIEFFLRRYTLIDWIAKDPILSKSYLRTDVMFDLILLENQLPFFVLEDIYNLAGMNRNFGSFLKITFHYFDQFNEQNIVTDGVEPKHFTDILRTFMLPSSLIYLGIPGQIREIKQAYSASQLLEAGLKLEATTETKCLLDFNYQKGVLTIPCLNLYDETESLLRNVVAFEQCNDYLRPPNITQYLLILHLLINNENDVKILVDKKIILNFLGDTNAVATMVKSLGKNCSLPYVNSRLLTIFEELNRFCKNSCNKNRAIFLREYFNTPWKKASTSAAIVLLLLTLIQTICSIISLF